MKIVLAFSYGVLDVAASYLYPQAVRQHLTAQVQQKEIPASLQEKIKIDPSIYSKNVFKIKSTVQRSKTKIESDNDTRRVQSSPLRLRFFIFTTTNKKGKSRKSKTNEKRKAIASTKTPAASSSIARRTNRF